MTRALVTGGRASSARTSSTRSPRAATTCSRSTTSRRARRDRVEAPFARGRHPRCRGPRRAVFADHRPDVVWHLAAQADVRLSVTDPAADAAVNVTGTINVLQAALDVGARVVFASTGGAIYGADAARPTPETAAVRAGGAVRHRQALRRGVRAPVQPAARHASTRSCASATSTAPARTRAARRAWSRSSPAASPATSAPTVFGDGLQTRDYVYVGDVVRGVRRRRPTPASPACGTSAPAAR